jgi:8-oxo-dGTP pyrophosphatase MutT (NUDIX family)
MKKKGFGAGKWNGYGGKPESNEDLLSAAVRESYEEIGVKIEKADLVKLGRMEFYFENNPDWNQEVTVFKASKWQGEPIETDEMNPQWFKVSEIPFDKMWLEDRHWMPLFLADRKFEGKFYYNNDGTKINNYDLREF